MPIATSSGAVGIGAVPNRGLQILRRNAHQDAESVGGLPRADLQFGDAGLGLGQGAPRLADVEFARGAGFKSGFDDRQGLTLQLDVEAGVFDLLLESPELHVICGDVAQQSHEDVVVVGHRGLEVRLVRLDRTAEATPEIELPAKVEPEVPLAEKAVQCPECRSRRCCWLSRRWPRYG